MTLDFTGKKCPIPVMQTKNALLAAAVGEGFEITVDNDAAVQNLHRLLGAMGQEFVRNGMTFVLVRSENLRDPFEIDAAAMGCEIPAAASAAGAAGVAGAASVAGAAGAAANRDGADVLLLKSQRIGEGELGGMLTVGFLTALVERKGLSAVVLINDAVLIATDAAHPAHAALSALAKAGVRVICCGNCLNYFGGLKPAVGEIGDALSIINLLFNKNTLSL